MPEHRILVIEDQEDLAALYEHTFMRAGYKVTNAYSGEEGVAEFGASGADLITLDMTLPEMHGTAALAEIREADASVPVIVITAETSDATRQECERLGVFAYLPKPPDYDQLTETVARALANQRDADDYEVVTLRLPVRTIAALQAINPNLEQAIGELCADRQLKARAAP